MPTLTASRETVEAFRRTRETLVAQLEELALITKEYPVVCTFAGHRVVFESKEDILDLIEELQGAVDRYDQHAEAV